MESNLDKARKIILNPNFATLGTEQQAMIMRQILASGVTKDQIRAFILEAERLRQAQTPKDNSKLIRELTDTINNPNFQTIDPDRRQSILEKFKRDLNYDQSSFDNLLATNIKIQPSRPGDEEQILEALRKFKEKDYRTVTNIDRLRVELGWSLEKLNRFTRENWKTKNVPIFYGESGEMDYVFSPEPVSPTFILALEDYLTRIRDIDSFNVTDVRRLIEQNNVPENVVNIILPQLWEDMNGGPPFPIYTPPQDYRNLAIDLSNRGDVRNYAPALNKTRQQLKMTFEDFNDFIRQNFKGKGPAPRLRDNPIRIVFEEQDRANPGPRPRGEVVDDAAATIEMGDLGGMINNMLTNELNKYGRNGVLVQDLMDLLNEIRPFMTDFVRAGMVRKSTNMPLEQYLTLMQDWKSRFNEIIQMDKALGRRCLNTHTPINEEPVEEIPDGEIIRLENGVCWDIDTLTDYIRQQKGKNDASALRNYPAKQIWDNADDLDRILRHQRSNERGFTQWFENRNVGENAAKISNETLNRMIIAASLLSSVGKPFKDAMQRELAQKPKLLEEWRRIKMNPDNLYMIKNEEIRKDIEQTIAITLKSLALVDFLNYYDNQISQEERDALDAIEPTFAKELRICQRGEHCVFGMARTLQTLRNQIAGVKGLPFIDLDPRIE